MQVILELMAGRVHTAAPGWKEWPCCNGEGADGGGRGQGGQGQGERQQGGMSGVQGVGGCAVRGDSV